MLGEADFSWCLSPCFVSESTLSEHFLCFIIINHYCLLCLIEAGFCYIIQACLKPTAILLLQSPEY